MTSTNLFGVCVVDCFARVVAAPDRVQRQLVHDLPAHHSALRRVDVRAGLRAERRRVGAVCEECSLQHTVHSRAIGLGVVPTTVDTNTDTHTTFDGSSKLVHVVVGEQITGWLHHVLL